MGGDPAMSSVRVGLHIHVSSHWIQQSNMQWKERRSLYLCSIDLKLELLDQFLLYIALGMR